MIFLLLFLWSNVQMEPETPQVTEITSMKVLAALSVETLGNL